jgi:hypothetical protein
MKPRINEIYNIVEDWNIDDVYRLISELESLVIGKEEELEKEELENDLDI